ncbi:hypothetical protein L9F63_018587, partial [Diploptera punctata]
MSQRARNPCTQAFRVYGYTVYEEVHGVATNGNTRTGHTPRPKVEIKNPLSRRESNPGRRSGRQSTFYNSLFKT